MCGIVGCYNCPKAIEHCYMLGHDLQHRAQEYAGGAADDGQIIRRHAGKGIVQDVFNQTILDGLHGKNAILHLRYSTVEDDPSKDCAQPILHGDSCAIAHNGNLINAPALISRHGLQCKTAIDSEVPLLLFAQTKAQTLAERIFLTVKDLRGSYSLLLMFNDTLVTVRDPYGNRPLVLGRRGDSWFVSSETVGFDKAGIEFIREVAPGEILIITKSGLSSFFFDELKLSTSQIEHQHAFCIFCLLYFAHPASHIFGWHVRTFRRLAGRRLWREAPVDADTIVVPIPDSSNDHAWGYCQEGHLELENLLLRSHYIGRTFIEAFQMIRNMKVMRKFAPDRELIAGRKIVLIDDSIVRLTTLPFIVEMMLACGAREVHARIGTPPIIDICPLGIDIPTRAELAAANLTTEQIRVKCHLDSLQYLSLPGLRSLLRNPDDYCMGCMNGHYRMLTV